MLKDCGLHRNTYYKYIKILIADSVIKEALFVDKRGSYKGYMVNPRLFRKHIDITRQALMISDYDQENVIILADRKVERI